MPTGAAQIPVAKGSVTGNIRSGGQKFVFRRRPLSTSLFRRNCLSIRKPWHIDDNLCEGAFGAEALCRNMRLMGKVPSLDVMVKEQLHRVIPARGAPLVPRCSIPPFPAGGFPARRMPSA